MFCFIQSVRSSILLGALAATVVSSIASAPRRSYLPVAGPGPIRFFAAFEQVAPARLPPLVLPDSDSNSESTAGLDPSPGHPDEMQSDPVPGPVSPNPLAPDADTPRTSDPNLLMSREEHSPVNPRMLLEFFRDTGTSGATNENRLAIPIDFEFSPPATTETPSSSATYTAP